MKTITDRVVDALQRNPACEFDLLMKECSEYTWNQLFYEVDRLSRVGHVLLTPVGDGRYFLRLVQGDESLHSESDAILDAASRPAVSAGTEEPAS